MYIYIYIYIYICIYIYKHRGGFRGKRGGGGLDASPLQGLDPLPTQRVPLCTILRYPFW